MGNTKFDAAWWDVWSMRKQAGQIAREEGVRRSDTDSFRHAYVTAKIADRFNIDNPVSMNVGDWFARTLGIGNELLGFNNSSKEHYIDLRNNEVGLKILSEVNKEIENKKKCK